MKKLAILAAAAIGYALANRAGRRQDLGHSGPQRATHEYQPSAFDPFVPDAPQVPLTLVEDRVEDAPEVSATDEPAHEEHGTDETVAEDLVSHDAAPDAVVDQESALESVSEVVVEDVYEQPLADVEAMSTAAELLDEAIETELEAELEAEPTVEPIVQEFVPVTPVAETHAKPDVPHDVAQVPAPPVWAETETTEEDSEEFEVAHEVTEPSTSEEDSENVEDTVADEPEAELQAEPEAETDAPTWDAGWVDDMPVPQQTDENSAVDDGQAMDDVPGPTEPQPPVKLSDLAENIVARVQTAADLAREDEPVVEVEEADDSRETDSVDRDSALTGEAFVAPKVEDFADEVFDGEEPDKE